MSGRADKSRSKECVYARADKNGSREGEGEKVEERRKEGGYDVWWKEKG